jgi:hypothetical protein
MKNKEKYDLRDLDYIVSEDYIEIIHLGFTNERAAIIHRVFDEPPFRAFLRWLEEEAV